MLSVAVHPLLSVTVKKYSSGPNVPCTLVRLAVAAGLATSVPPAVVPQS